MKKTGMLVNINSTHFNCGIILENDVCTKAAPIMAKWAIGKKRAWLSQYFASKGWKAIVVDEWEVQDGQVSK